MNKIIVFVCLLVLCSCAPTNPNIPDPHRYNELTPDVSTMDDAVRILGVPNTYKDIGHNKIIWQWFDDNPKTPIHLAILFRTDTKRMDKVESVVLP
jgi:hypothetical protein